MDVTFKLRRRYYNSKKFTGSLRLPMQGQERVASWSAVFGALFCLSCSHQTHCYHRNVLNSRRSRSVLAWQRIGVSPCPVCCVFQPAFGCCAHSKAGWTTFSSRFQPFLLYFQKNSFLSLALGAWGFSDVFCKIQAWNHRKRFKRTKKVEKGWKKKFDQLLGARSTQKLVEIYNICQHQSFLAKSLCI